MPLTPTNPSATRIAGEAYYQRPFATGALTNAGTDTHQDYLMPQQLAIGAADASGQLVHGLRASHERVLPAQTRLDLPIPNV